MPKSLNFLNLFNSLSNLQKSLVVSILAIVLFGLSTAGSYSLFSKVGGGKLISSSSSNSTIPKVVNTSGENPDEPKVASCPLNGSMHTQKAEDAWKDRRPLAVMIENHTDARPQSGLSYADVVYETVAEGGITRFMGIFYCNSLPEVQVGPVRSARTYFIDWLSEYGSPLYAHVGGANTPGPADALGQIIKYGINDLNQFGIGFPTYWRDYQRLGHPVATEHTMYSTTTKLWAVGSQRGWGAVDADTNKNWVDSFIPWKFKDDASAGSNPPSGTTLASKVDVEFWQGYSDYAVTWTYDAKCDCYKRQNAGKDHIDLDTKQQLTTKNIVVQFERESHANDGYENNAHLLYGTIGTGEALIFQDGVAIKGSWVKQSRLARTKYLNASGKEIAFNKGPIWIETVPEGANVRY